MSRHWVGGILALGLALGAPAAGFTREAAAAVSPSGRFILLEGGRNFRDLGGYQTDDGRRVRWGQFYRSGSLGSLTVAGQQRLASLHPASIVDLRTTDERGRDRNNWLAMAGLGYWSRDYDMSVGDMAAMFARPENRTAPAVRAMMAQAYRRIAVEQAPGYRVLFARLVEGGGPVVVNCTAGKDRTGIAAALVLTALGVPYATVRGDFLLSNGAPGMAGLQSALSGPLQGLPADAIAPLLGVEGEYLDNAFDQLRRDYGSIDAFLAQELGVGPSERAVLRRRLLTP